METKCKENCSCEHQPKLKLKRKVKNHRRIDYIVVHCTATRKGKEYDANDINNWHLQKGWKSGIGYHYVVLLDGTIQVGRHESVVGTHVKGYNRHSIGVVYVGGMDHFGKVPEDTRTFKQICALRDLLEALKSRNPQAQIWGHRDFPGVTKACPCFDAIEEYKDLNPCNNNN